ncbi:hypothetical protein EKD04_014420 [Chloroflexales bacterium ZM16-3]|nr:hypothetical protein [Chloroflexales bacterium ZM16-3]
MRTHLLVAALGICVMLVLAPNGAGAQTPPPVIAPQEDALTPPPPPPSLSDADNRGPSQYMAGRVAVQVLLPQSDNPAHAWSQPQITQIHDQIQAALDWWVARLPLARLSFTVRLQVVPITYEPMSYGLVDEGRWIGDVLSRLGYTGSSYFSQAYAADRALRDELGADWVTTIFVANSSGASGGTFPDGRFAYAYINGPFMVLTSDVGGYGAARMAPVVAHELGHIFGALDQYAAARVSCAQESGYLSVPTTNSQYNSCGTNLPSIMLEILGSFSNGQIDPSAMAQVGYRDSDSDGLIDPLDTTTELNLAPMLTPEPGARPLLSGQSRDVAFPSPSNQDVSINQISAVEYRVDGGIWLPTKAADGSFDSGDEDFSTTLPLYDGEYLVEVRARNSAGVESPLSSGHVTVSQVGPQPSYYPSLPPFTAHAEILVRLDAPDGTQSVQISADLGFGAAAWQRYSPELSFSLDGRDGVQTVYVRYRDAAGLVSLPIALDVVLDTTPPDGSAARDPQNSTRLILKAHDDGTGVAEVGIELGGSDPLWMTYQADISLSGLAGLTADTPSMRVLFRDAAGNTSLPYTVTSDYAVFLPLVVR